jgi:hypothetical protein
MRSLLEPRSIYSHITDEIMLENQSSTPVMPKCVAVEEATRFQDFGSGKIAYSPMKDRNKFSVLDRLRKEGSVKLQVFRTQSVHDNFWINGSHFKFYEQKPNCAKRCNNLKFRHGDLIFSS